MLPIQACIRAREEHRETGLLWPGPERHSCRSPGWGGTWPHCVAMQCGSRTENVCRSAPHESACQHQWLPLPAQGCLGADSGDTRGPVQSTRGLCIPALSSWAGPTRDSSSWMSLADPVREPGHRGSHQLHGVPWICTLGPQHSCVLRFPHGEGKNSQGGMGS